MKIKYTARLAAARVAPNIYESGAIKCFLRTDGTAGNRPADDDAY
ncbi:hypothetical protein [Octadecabacter antarcticus]|nr:hypothetical protein [Octadecabacter antarcticus]